MSETELVAAIRRAPHDDAPRLVYADALSRRGDVRGELITLACEIARREAAHDVGEEYMSLVERSWALLRKHKRDWQRAMGLADALWCTWRRGFVEVVNGDADDIAASAAALFALPVDHILIASRSRADFARVSASGAVGAAPKLGVSCFGPEGNRMDAESIRLLASLDALSGVSSLRLDLSPFPEELDAMVRASSLSRLHSLDVGWGIHDAMIASTHGHWSAHLRELTIHERGMTKRGYVSIASDISLCGLEALQFRTADPDPGAADDAMRAVASSPYLTCLTKLGFAAVGPAGVDALAHGPSLGGIKSLSLSSAKLDAASMRALLTAMPGLEELRLSCSDVDTPALEVLAALAPPSLRSFALHMEANDRRAASGVCRLLTSSRFVLRELELIGEMVDDDVASTLATSPAMASLTSLRLIGPYGPSGSAAMIASTVLARGLRLIIQAYNPAQAALYRRFPLLDLR